MSKESLSVQNATDTYRPTLLMRLTAAIHRRCRHAFDRDPGSPARDICIEHCVNTLLTAPYVDDMLNMMPDNADVATGSRPVSASCWSRQIDVPVIIVFLNKSRHELMNEGLVTG